MENKNDADETIGDGVKMFQNKSFFTSPPKCVT